MAYNYHTDLSQNTKNYELTEVHVFRHNRTGVLSFAPKKVLGPASKTQREATVYNELNFSHKLCNFTTAVYLPAGKYPEGQVFEGDLVFQL